MKFRHTYEHRLCYLEVPEQSQGQNVPDLQKNLVRSLDDASKEAQARMQQTEEGVTALRQRKESIRQDLQTMEEHKDQSKGSIEHFQVPTGQAIGFVSDAAVDLINKMHYPFNTDFLHLDKYLAIHELVYVNMWVQNGKLHIEAIERDGSASLFVLSGNNQEKSAVPMEKMQPTETYRMAKIAPLYHHDLAVDSPLLCSDYIKENGVLADTLKRIQKMKDIAFYQQGAKTILITVDGVKVSSFNAYDGNGDDPDGWELAFAEAIKKAEVVREEKLKEQEKQEKPERSSGSA